MSLLQTLSHYLGFFINYKVNQTKTEQREGSVICNDNDRRKL